MDDLIATLREENANLRERIRQLEAELVPDDVVVPQEWQLVNAERRIFSALTRRDVVTKETLYQALYGDRLDLDKEPELSVVESHVSKMRKKLRPFGVVVTGKRFVGYSLLNRQKYAGAPPRDRPDDGGAAWMTSSTSSVTASPSSKSVSASSRRP